MSRQQLEPSQPDGQLLYRYDSTGRLVALLPGRCKLGQHVLDPSEYRAVVQDGETRISCEDCAAEGIDHRWRLTTTIPAPQRAEVSDEFYLDLILHWQQASPSLPGGRRA